VTGKSRAADVDFAEYYKARALLGSLCSILCHISARLSAETAAICKGR
jgi:hypothetical protein